MDQFDHSLEVFIDGAGWFAPILFVLLHLFRPLFFIPVIVVCIAGGVLFGFVKGAILSFIGLSLMCFASYLLINQFPKFHHGLTRMKEKLLKNDQRISVGQVMVLRIMPFVHFHLLSFYLMEITKSFKEYMYYSVLGVIMPAILYTAFGEAITELSWYSTALLFFLLVVIYSSLGKWNKSRAKPKHKYQ